MYSSVPNKGGTTAILEEKYDHYNLIKSTMIIYFFAKLNIFSHNLDFPPNFPKLIIDHYDYLVHYDY